MERENGVYSSVFLIFSYFFNVHFQRAKVPVSAGLNRGGPQGDRLNIGGGQNGDASQGTQEVVMEEGSFHMAATSLNLRWVRGMRGIGVVVEKPRRWFRLTDVWVSKIAKSCHKWWPDLDNCSLL